MKNGEKPIYYDNDKYCTFTKPAWHVFLLKSQSPTKIVRTDLIGYHLLKNKTDETSPKGRKDIFFFYDTISEQKIVKKITHNY